MEIGNKDFITILDSTNPNDMMPDTNYCSKPTDDVSEGSVGHIESPQTLIITSILLSSSVDLILGSKNRFITILTGFTGGSNREVAYLGLESTGL